MLFQDQMNRHIQLDFPPQHIISLVPSQTELLAYLGLEQEVVGITKFCIHPNDWFRSKTRIGGTKQFNFEKIEALQADLIIGNKEENEQIAVEKLMQKYPVWMSDIFDLADALEMIEAIGKLTNRAKKANELVEAIKFNFSQLQITKAYKVAYLIWRNPYMAVGSDTFINNMLQLIGFQNILSNQSRYPTTSLEELKALNPELILLSSEPYPFKEKHIKEVQAACPNAKVILVDGEYFSWYGSRLLDAPKYFNELIQSI